MQTDSKSAHNKESSPMKKKGEPLEEVKSATNTPVKKMPPLLPSSCFGTDDTDKFLNICAHLQLIFARLQYSCRRYYT
jgi:hypothetical protein